MKLNNKFVRGVVLVAGIVLLILPSFMMSAIYSSIDLEFAMVAVLTTVLTAVWLPKLRWICAVIASLLIAVPPYPYWLSFDAKRGWYFHFFYGFDLQNTPFLVLGGAFAVSQAVFAAIFWAISRPIPLGRVV
jgi:hypothetical protein